jgi:hypothetical protein
MRIITAVLAAPLLALGLASCDEDNESAEPTASPAASATRTEAAPTAAPEPFDGGRGPIERADSPAPPVAIHVAVETSEQGNFDRAVFTFEEKIPGFRVEYVDPPIFQDASGEEVAVDGEAFLQVRFSTAQAHDEAGNSTYEGPRELRPNSPAFLELENTGDFEGYVTWVIGLPQELDFRVAETTDPFRIFVEVAHP